MAETYIPLSAALNAIRNYDFKSPELLDGWARRCRQAMQADLTDDMKAIPPADVAPAPRWISVEERLPEDRENCLLWYEYYHYSIEEVRPEYGIGFYIKKYGIWVGDPSTGKDVKVLYWMPLPEPPEEGGGEDGE